MQNSQTGENMVAVAIFRQSIAQAFCKLQTFISAEQAHDIHSKSISDLFHRQETTYRRRNVPRCAHFSAEGEDGHGLFARQFQSEKFIIRITRKVKRDPQMISTS